MKYTSGTNSWEVVGNPEASNSIFGHPSLAIYDGIPYVAYYDSDNSCQATVMKFNPLKVEGDSTFRWLRGEEVIAGATGMTYTTTAEDSNKTVTFEVTPVSAGLVQ